MTFTSVLFYILAVVLVVAAFRVINATSPVTAVLHLILTFFTAAMLWMLLDAEFLALILTIVYVGAVMVLFLFIVMMLDIRLEGLRGGLRTYLPMGLGIGIIMVLEMAFVLGKTWFDAGERAALPTNYDNTHALGLAIYNDYVFAVEVAAVVLLVGMVAAISLTLRRRHDVKVTDPSEQVKVRARDRVRLVSIPSQTETPSSTAGLNDNPEQGSAK